MKPMNELDYIPENAVDGDCPTRWSGLAPTDLPYHYLMIDLGEDMHWEGLHRLEAIELLPYKPAQA